MGRNVNYAFIIFNFSSGQNENNNISIDFIDFFKNYFQEKNFTEEIKFNLRFYIFLFHSYIDYLKFPDKELFNCWDVDIKPFLLKKYSFEQSGIFNVNADIKYFITEIDKIIKKLNYKEINKNILEKKEQIIKIPSNEDIKDLENVSPLSDTFKLDQEQDEFEDDLEIIKIEDEEELINSRKRNNAIYNNIKNDNIKDDVKRTISLNDLKCHSSTIASKSTAVSIYDELNNKAEEFRSTISFDATNIKKNIKEITPYFSDEFETEGVTLVHKKGVIVQMTYNLFLKKIIVGNFFDEYFEYTINFTEQCFYFMKRDIAFRKIINCYKYYTDLKVPFIQRKKLIHFMNILVIKMYECFTKIEYKEEVLSIIKKFYNDLISELKTIVSKSKKRSSKLQDFFFGGINAIKSGVNNFKDNLKIGNDNKKKEQNDINKDEEVKNIKDNLNTILTKRQQIKEEQEKEQNNLNINKKEDNINIDKNKEKEKENEKEKTEENQKMPEEEVLTECEKIISLFKNEVPKQDILIQTEQTLLFYKLKIKFQNNKKSNISRNIVRKLKKSNTERYLTPVLEENKAKEINTKKKNYFSCKNYEAKDIGEELIYISQLALNKIKRKELYNGAFLKKSKLITSPNIIENINRFNNLTYFIVEDILSYDLPKDRADIIERWANIADYCKKRKDYNDVFAINSAFKNYIIFGLELTWKEVKSKAKKIIKDIENFCNFEGNYKNVREDMKSLNKNDFYTPYLGLLLKDLNFYEETGKYIVNGNFINFEKINGVQNSIEDFFHFQKTKDKKKVELIPDLNFFENLENQKEDYLENLASKLEPKFTLYMNPKTFKRLTYIDKKHFRGHSGKGMMSNSLRQSYA